jgi:hypothetical protein
MIFNIPIFQCKLRSEFLYDLKRKHNELEDVTVFAAHAWQGHALLFFVMTRQGAVYDKVPISALVHSEMYEELDFYILQMWDCMSDNAQAQTINHLGGFACKVKLKNGDVVDGNYKFTINFDPNPHPQMHSLVRDTADHKVAHFIKLHNGQFAAYPNNRILFLDPNFTPTPFEEVPDYEVCTQEYIVEAYPKFSIKDDTKFGYE